VRGHVGHPVWPPSHPRALGIATHQLAVRGEYFKDKDGARMGTPQDLWEVTLTAGYKWVKSFETRLEYRHDQSDARSFDRVGRSAKSQDMLATEAIFRF
jgi:hypothetical protein